MGKVLIVGIFFVSAIFIIIILSSGGAIDKGLEDVSKNFTEMQVKQLCSGALDYGIKKVNIAGADSLETYTQTFIDFEVGKGIIDSIEYVTIGDTMRISAHATYQDGDNTFHHRSTSFVTWALVNGTAAITANGPINVDGSAVVNGKLLPNLNPPLDFEEFFGMTKVQMQAIADTVETDPSNNPDLYLAGPGSDTLSTSGTTYIKFSNPTSELKVTTNGWKGEGILVVEGDARFNGGTFNGVMWITGSLIVTGNENFSGAIYVEGIDPSGGEATPVPLLGNCEITYDAGAIIDAMGIIGQVMSYELKVISIFDDDL